MSTPRMLAEWEECDYILMTLPDELTDWEYMLPEVTACYREMCRTMIDAGERVVMLCRDRVSAQDSLGIAPSEQMVYVECEYNDTWMRDYGPLTVEVDGKRKALDFGFNGWGLKFAADKDNLVCHRLNSDNHLFADGAYENNLDYVLEGGSLEVDGRGTLLTTTRCLCSMNRNGGLSKEQVAEQLRSRLGITHILWLDNGFLAGDDTDSHIDTLTRMCLEDTILYTECDDPQDMHYAELSEMKREIGELRTADGKPYRMISLPMPDAVFDEDGERIPATFANYLVTPRNLFMPVYGNDEQNRRAAEAIQKAFPHHRILFVDCSALIRQHGSLHCATMQVPKNILNL